MPPTTTAARIRRVELMRLACLKEYPDRFEVSARLPALVDDADLIEWRKVFESGGPPGSSTGNARG